MKKMLVVNSKADWIDVDDTIEGEKVDMKERKEGGKTIHLHYDNLSGLYFLMDREKRDRLVNTECKNVHDLVAKFGNDYKIYVYR